MCGSMQKYVPLVYVTSVGIRKQLRTSKYTFNVYTDGYVTDQIKKLHNTPSLNWCFYFINTFLSSILKIKPAQA
jgi:hypothetical protein